jgi:preprotein translocase subunit SecG
METILLILMWLVNGFLLYLLVTKNNDKYGENNDKVKK